MSITSVELANLCGVSRATVDRALKGKPGISEETRKRILDTAQAYQYRPNILASSLSTGRSHAVGIVVFDLKSQHFTELVTAIENYFSERNVFSYICISHKDPERERSLLQSMTDRKVDGIVLTSVCEGAEYAQWLRSLNIPIVPVSNRIADMPLVAGDGFEGARTGMRYLYDKGCRTIHFVCPPLRRRGKENIYAQQVRADGYLAFREEHPDISGEVISCEGYLEHIEDLVRNAQTRPVFFCSSDVYLIKIRKYLYERGFDIAKDYALMGFDGLDSLNQFTYRPDSIKYPAQAIGEEAAAMLDAMIRGESPRQEALLPCPLLPGNIPVQ